MALVQNMERDVYSSLREITTFIKDTVSRNLLKGNDTRSLGLTRDQLSSIDELVKLSVDQAVTNSSISLDHVFKKYGELEKSQTTKTSSSRKRG